MLHIKSILEQVIKDLYQAQTIDEGKKIMLGVVEKSNIKQEDKTRMKNEVLSIVSLTKLQFYVTNCMFKYEGLGVNNNFKSK